MDDLLAEARSVLPLRPGPAEALAAQAKGALLIDIRSDDQRRASGLIPGALVLPRNSLEWRCRRGLPPRLRQVPRGTLARMAIDRWAARGPRQVVAAAIEHARLTHFQLHRAGRDMHTLNRQAARCYASLAMAASPS